MQAEEATVCSALEHASGNKCIWRTEVYKYNYPISVLSTVTVYETVYLQMCNFTSVGNI